MSTSSSEGFRPRGYGTLLEALADAPARRPFVTMWYNDDNAQTVTFAEFRSLAAQHASYFRKIGVDLGDRIVLILPQGIELMMAFAGAMMGGAVPAILAYPNPKVEPGKYRSGLAGVTAKLKARVVVIDEAFPAKLVDYITPGREAKFVRLGSCPPTSADTWRPDPRVNGQTIAFIQHSAGTTGLQKGVALSHAAVLRQLNHLACALNIGEEDRIYSWLPLYHDMGLIACFMLPLAFHLPVVMQSPIDWVMQPGTMLRLISAYRCSLAWVPNFALQFLARRVRVEERSECDLSSLRALVNCAEPVRAQSMDEFRSAYAACRLPGNALQSSYAMAENVFAVTQSGMNGEVGPRRIWVDGERLRSQGVAAKVPEMAAGAVCLVSSGQCLKGNEVRVVSQTGDDVPAGVVGEILIRSDSLFSGYYNRPDLTAAALKDGWYWSGDLGIYLEGELYVIGRKKDMIICAGRNIYPQDVEETVCSHPAIHDGRAVAFGLYNPDLGTEDIVVVAEVEREEYLRDPVGVEQAIRNSVVAEFGVAMRAVFLKPPGWIVKSTAGKAARSTTREKLLAEHPELGGGDG